MEKNASSVHSAHVTCSHKGKHCASVCGYGVLAFKAWNLQGRMRTTWRVRCVTLMDLSMSVMCFCVKLMTVKMHSRDQKKRPLLQPSDGWDGGKDQIKENLHKQEMLLCNHILGSWDSTYKNFLDQKWPEEGMPSIWEPQTNENIHYIIFSTTIMLKRPHCL